MMKNLMYNTLAVTALVMAFAGPMGFFYAMLNAPAQTVLHERAPPEMRGRIFATQVVSANFISLIPLLMVGVITDVLNITAMLIILAVLVAGFAMLSEQLGPADWEEDPRDKRKQEPVHT